jgi:hypothetical protein
VFQISCWLFGRDYALFRSSDSQMAQRPKRTRKRGDKSVEVEPAGAPARTAEPFVLHIVGEDQPPPGGQPKPWS